MFGSDEAAVMRTSRGRAENAVWLRHETVPMIVIGLEWKVLKQRLPRCVTERNNGCVTNDVLKPSKMSILQAQWPCNMHVQKPAGYKMIEPNT
jgi:hypothetical protein